MSLLATEQLAKAFGGVRAVDGVSFAVDAGEIVALIGPNGAGKSTCFNLLNGQLAPDAGRIRLAGEDIAGRTPRLLQRLGIARTFQITATFGSLTARENVQVALLAAARRLASPFSSAAAQFREEAQALLAQVGLPAQAERTCAELAYGDLKRVELAVALAAKPRVLLMDEPTAGMAPAERGALMQLAAGEARRAGMAVLFTEHDMEVVFAHADRVLVMAEGRLIAQGAPAAVRVDPRVREVYLGSDAGA